MTQTRDATSVTENVTVSNLETTTYLGMHFNFQIDSLGAVTATDPKKKLLLWHFEVTAELTRISAGEILTTRKECFPSLLRPKTLFEI